MTGDTTHSLRRALARVFSPPERKAISYSEK